MSQDGVARCIGCNEPAAPERVGGLDVSAMRHVEHVVNIHPITKECSDGRSE